MKKALLIFSICTFSPPLMAVKRRRVAIPHPEIQPVQQPTAIHHPQQVNPAVENQQRVNPVVENQQRVNPVVENQQRVNPVVENQQRVEPVVENRAAKTDVVHPVHPKVVGVGVTTTSGDSSHSQIEGAMVPSITPLFLDPEPIPEPPVEHGVKSPPRFLDAAPKETKSFHAMEDSEDASGSCYALMKFLHAVVPSWELTDPQKPVIHSWGELITQVCTGTLQSLVPCLLGIEGECPLTNHPWEDPIQSEKLLESVTDLGFFLVEHLLPEDWKNVVKVANQSIKFGKWIYASVSKDKTEMVLTLHSKPNTPPLSKARLQRILSIPEFLPDPSFSENDFVLEESFPSETIHRGLQKIFELGTLLFREKSQEEERAVTASGESIVLLKEQSEKREDQVIMPNIELNLGKPVSQERSAEDQSNIQYVDSLLAQLEAADLEIQPYSNSLHRPLSISIYREKIERYTNRIHEASGLSKTIPYGIEHKLKGLKYLFVLPSESLFEDSDEKVNRLLIRCLGLRAMDGSFEYAERFTHGEDKKAYEKNLDLALEWVDNLRTESAPVDPMLTRISAKELLTILQKKEKNPDIFPLNKEKKRMKTWDLAEELYQSLLKMDEEAQMFFQRGKKVSLALYESDLKKYEDLFRRYKDLIKEETFATDPTKLNFQWVSSEPTFERLLEESCGVTLASDRLKTGDWPKWEKDLSRDKQKQIVSGYDQLLKWKEDPKPFSNRVLEGEVLEVCKLFNDPKLPTSDFAKLVHQYRKEVRTPSIITKNGMMNNLRLAVSEFASPTNWWNTITSPIRKKSAVKPLSTSGKKTIQKLDEDL